MVEDLIERATRVALAVATVGGILWATVRFIFEPHVTRVVKAVVKAEFAAKEKAEAAEVEAAKDLARRMGLLEDRMSKVESGAERTSDAVGRVEEGMARQTKILERLTEKLEVVTLTTARIEERTTERGVERRREG